MTQSSALTTPPVTRINGDQTKEKILNAAEHLFGEHGYDTVSLRDITKKAGVTLALASYHFQTKSNLFELVISRRAGTLSKLRKARLADVKNSGNLSLRTILEAFIEPLFTQMQTDDEGWQSYVLLLSKLGLSNRWLDVIRENFDETAGIFISELRKIMPDTTDEGLLRAFSLVLHLMLQGVSKNQRLDTLSNGAYRADELDKTYDTILDFAVAGMKSVK